MTKTRVTRPYWKHLQGGIKKTDRQNDEEAWPDYYKAFVYLKFPSNKLSVSKQIIIMILGHFSGRTHIKGIERPTWPTSWLKAERNTERNSDRNTDRNTERNSDRNTERNTERNTDQSSRACLSDWQLPCPADFSTAGKNKIINKTRAVWYESLDQHSQNTKEF